MTIPATPEQIEAMTLRLLNETFPTYALAAPVQHVEKGWLGEVIKVSLGSAKDTYRVRWTAPGRGMWESFNHAMDFVAR